MNQIFTCSSCGNTVTYGEKFCGECGAPMDWSFLQTTHDPSSGYPGQPYQQPYYANTPQPPAGWNQAPPGQTWQQNPQATFQTLNQQGKKALQPLINIKISPVVRTGILLFFVIGLIVFAGIAIATNGSIFKSDINQPASKPAVPTPTLEPPPQSVPPQPAAIPVITSFKSNPSSIQAGQTTTLTWDVTGANSITIDHGINNVASSGSQQVSPSSTTTYVLTAANGAGSVTASATISVTGAPSNMPAIATFTASPESVTPGGSSTLQWNVTGATSIIIDQGIGTVSAAGTKSVNPSASTTYTITATSIAGSVTAAATVTVGNAPVTGPPVINSFTATPSTIVQGQSTTLQWNITGATSLSIDNNVGSPSLRSSPVLSPLATTTYTLTATNSAGSVTAKATVTVTNPGSPVISSFTANPNPIASGGQCALQWVVTGATSVAIDQGIGAVNPSDSRQVNPTTTTTYTITATNSAGIVTATTTVNITETTVGLPVITSFTAAPATVSPGGMVTLSWTISNAVSITIEPGVGTLTSGTQRQIYPTATTTYTLTATNAVGSSTRALTVIVQ